MDYSNECRKTVSRRSDYNIAETKVFETIIMKILLTLTYSVFLDEPVNVALAVEYRCADLEERDTSA